MVEETINEIEIREEEYEEVEAQREKRISKNERILRELTSHKPSLQCILEGLLWMEVFLRI